MPDVRRALQFHEAFIGPSVGRDQLPGALPDMQNLKLSPDGRTLEPFPGFRRTYPYDLLRDTILAAWDSTNESIVFKTSAEIAADASLTVLDRTGLRIVRFPAQAILTGGGNVIGVVDEATGRIMALAFHAGGDVLDPLNDADDRPPQEVGWLHRVGAHDYPAVLNFRSLTHFCQPWDEQVVWDGRELRLCGLRDPQIWPVLNFQGSLVTIIDDASATWALPAARTNYQLDGTGTYTSIFIDEDDREPGSLGYTATTDLAGSIPSDAVSLSIQVRVWAGEDIPHNEDGHLWVILRPSAPSAGDLMEGVEGTDWFKWPVRWKLSRDQWALVDIPWGDFDSAFSVGTVGLYLNQTVTLDRLTSVTWPDASTADGMRIDFQVYYRQDSGDTSGLPQGHYLFAFAWYDSERRQESRLSYFGDHDGKGGTGDSRFEDWFYCDGNEPLIVKCSGARTDLADYPANYPNTPPPDADKLRLYITRYGWAPTETGAPQFHLWGEYDLDDLDSDLAITITEDRDLDVVLTDRTPYYEGGRPPTCAAMVPDGQRVVWMGQPTYAVGRCMLEDNTDFRGHEVVKRLLAYWDGLNSHTVTYVETAASAPDGYVFDERNTPMWGPWTEQREFRVDGNAHRESLVVKALPSNTTPWDGIYDRLLIWPLEGVTSLSEARYKIIGHDTRMWWSTVTTQGADPESVAPANYRDLDMPGDSIMGACKLGEILCVVGRRSTVFLRQDTLALDDIVGSIAYPSERRFWGGTCSGRSIVELPERVALWLSPAGKLLMATPEGVSIHPASERIEAWLRDSTRISQDDLRYAHAHYDANDGLYMIWFPEGTGAEFGVWDDSAPTQQHISWLEAD